MEHLASRLAEIPGVVPNGGAWLTIDGARVDFIYRELGVFREVGYVAGVPTYSYAAELALNRVLVGSLPRPAFPQALRRSAPPWWRRIAAGARTGTVTSHGPARVS